MAKYSYKDRKYFSLKDACTGFDSDDELIDALKDGEIVAEGRKISDADYAHIEDGTVAAQENGEPFDSEHEPIKPYVWQIYEFDKENFTLILRFSSKHGASGIHTYYDIQIKKLDLDKFVEKEGNQTGIIKKTKERKRDKTIHYEIGLIINSLTKRLGEFPSATKVWNEIVEQQAQIRCIVDIRTCSCKLIRTIQKSRPALERKRPGKGLQLRTRRTDEWLSLLFQFRFPSLKRWSCALKSLFSVDDQYQPAGLEPETLRWRTLDRAGDFSSAKPSTFRLLLWYVLPCGKHTAAIRAEYAHRDRP